MNSLARLTSTVLDGGYCIGCGACTALAGSPLAMKLDPFGRFQAEPIQTTRGADLPLTAVCPFAEDATNEDELAARHFPTAPHRDERIGRYISCYAGHVSEEEFRARGSSGGLAKWLLEELLRNQKVDAVIQVTATEPGDGDALLYRYSLARSPADVRRGSKSAYYPVQMAEVLEVIRREPGRYAITGVPCFIKALRLLAAHEPTIAERVVFTIGVICGHFKSTGYAQLLGWQFGIPPEELRSIDFRRKLLGRRANDKGICVTSTNAAMPEERSAIVKELYGGPYNLGFFQYRACDYCDDVVAETADVSVGDAWLPEYIKDPHGTSVVVVRHPVIAEMVEAGRREGRLHLDTLTAERVAESQAGGLRQRREGLAYRLFLSDRKGEWRPPKRVTAQKNHISAHRRRIYKLRAMLSAHSHIAFQRALAVRRLDRFKEEMAPLLKRYEKLQYGPFAERLKRLVRRVWTKVARGKAPPAKANAASRDAGPDRGTQVKETARQ